MINNFIELLRQKAGRSIYIWGANGQTVPGEDWIKSKESGNDRKRALALYAKLLTSGIKPEDICAFDCSGLIYWALKKLGLISSDISSAGLYSASRKIKRDELSAGDLVFRHNGIKIHHVGCYIGGGKVIECKGRDHGVVLCAMDSWGKTYWNRYGRLEKLSGAASGTMPLLRLKSPRMRDGSLGVCGIKEVQNRLEELGISVGKCGADGIYGSATQNAVKQFQREKGLKTDGIVGEKTRGALGL